MNAHLSKAISGLTGTVTTVVIGAGHAGLSVSRCLSERSIDHIVLERGQVANSWIKERWDSLRLLTPNWQNALPGYRYNGDDPNGFMTMSQVTNFITDYAKRICAPVKSGVTVLSVTKTDFGYRVVTDSGEWRCRSVVLATGACNKASVPAVASKLASSVHSMTSMSYRNPNQLNSGGVLIVGASATGLQLAQEIQQSGRQVTLAVGEHVRMPRTYRGKDIQWWMDAAGILDRKISDEEDIARALRVPSPQLIGSPDHATLDLNSLSDQGVSLVGRLAGIRDNKVQFSGTLRNNCAMADLKLNRLLDTFDEYAKTADSEFNFDTVERMEPTRLPERLKLQVDLTRGDIQTVIWATGYKPDYSWLHLPVLDKKGKLTHDRGVVSTPAGFDFGGLYAMGLSYMRTRKSSFIYGAKDDARAITAHLANYLDKLAVTAVKPVISANQKSARAKAVTASLYK